MLPEGPLRVIPLGVRVTVGGLADGLGDGAGLGLGDGAGEGLGEGDGLGAALGAGEGEGVGSGAGTSTLSITWTMACEGSHTHIHTRSTHVACMPGHKDSNKTRVLTCTDDTRTHTQAWQHR